jgi:hypothetical protein
MGTTLMFSADYHRGSRWSGDIAVPEYRQFDVAHAGVVS